MHYHVWTLRDEMINRYLAFVFDVSQERYVHRTSANRRRRRIIEAGTDAKKVEVRHCWGGAECPSEWVRTE
jgi:hypothetical protein